MAEINDRMIHEGKVVLRTNIGKLAEGNEGWTKLLTKIYTHMHYVRPEKERRLEWVEEDNGGSKEASWKQILNNELLNDKNRFIGFVKGKTASFRSLIVLEFLYLINDRLGRLFSKVHRKLDDLLHKGAWTQDRLLLIQGDINEVKKMLQKDELQSVNSEERREEDSISLSEFKEGMYKNTIDNVDLLISRGHSFLRVRRHDPQFEYLHNGLMAFFAKGMTLKFPFCDTYKITRVQETVSYVEYSLEKVK